MILNAYSLYDRKALQYHTPFFATADGSAVRSVSDLVADPNTTVGRHPGDYVLYRVGAYDDASGSMLPASVLEHIVDCSALVRVNIGGGNAQPELFAELSEAAAMTKANGKSSIP